MSRSKKDTAGLGTSEGEASTRSTSQRSILEEKGKTTKKRKNNLYYKQSKANSKKKKGSITSQSTGKRKEDGEPIDNRELSCSPNEMNNNPSEREEIHTLCGAETPSSSATSIEKHTIYEEGLRLTDKDFIQQQIHLLSTQFIFQDCPKLVHLQGTKAARKDHIPEDVIQDSLRKLNHRMDDEIQKHLNRQCQRKVLSDLLDVENEMSVNEKQDDRDKTTIKETMDISEILTACPEEWHSEEDDDLMRHYSSTLEELKQTDAELKETNKKIISSKSNIHLISEVECLAKESTQNPIHKEMVRTSQLVNQIVKVLHMQANPT